MIALFCLISVIAGASVMSAWVNRPTCPYSTLSYVQITNRMLGLATVGYSVWAISFSEWLGPTKDTTHPYEASGRGSAGPRIALEEMPLLG